jgi:hypothetical protein
MKEWLTLLAPYFSSLAAVLAIWWTRNAVIDLKVHINHRMDQLLQERGDAKFAQGVKSETDKAKATESK